MEPRSRRAGIGNQGSLPQAKAFSSEKIQDLSSVSSHTMEASAEKEVFSESSKCQGPRVRCESHLLHFPS